MSNTLAKNFHQCFPLIKRPQLQITNTPKQHMILCLPLTLDSSTSSPPSSVSNTDTDMSEAVDLDTPDLTAAYVSTRFFISSPGRSNSIVGSYNSASTSSPEPPPVVVDGVAMEIYSPDPCLDFRRSMEEMVVACEVARGEEWQYLQELLLSYLTLNPKKTHKYIVRAFVDVVVSSMSPINNNNATTSSSSPSFSSNCCDHCIHRNSDSYFEKVNNNASY